MADIIYSDLSYKLVGILYRIHSELGSRYQEKYYQRAFELALQKEKIEYKKELKVDLNFDNQKIGNYFLDFLVDNKIVVEFKTVDRLSGQDIKQVLAYLKSTGIKLGILVNFRNKSLIYKRIINIK